MTPHPRLSRAGIDLVERFEGLRRKAARLEGGGWTIGYGHTASAREGAEVTEAEAEALLIYDLDRIAHAVDAAVFTPLSRNQFNALVAFAFNIGIDNFRASAVLRRVNEGAYLQAAAAIELWRKADFHGQDLVVDALVRRRAAEKVLFLTPSAGFRPVPTAVVRPAHDAVAADLRPLGEGLRAAADLRTPLEGDLAVPERHGEGAIETAARGVASRLQSLYPEPAPEPVEDADPGLPEAPPFPQAEAWPDAEPPPAPPPMAAMAAARQGQDTHSGPADGSELSITEFGRRAMVDPPARPSFTPQALLDAPYPVLVAGAFGALMFIGALVALLAGKATLLNLLVGLVGVGAMAPAALRMLLHLFGERPAGGQGEG